MGVSAGGRARRRWYLATVAAVAAMVPAAAGPASAEPVLQTVSGTVTGPAGVLEHVDVRINDDTTGESCGVDTDENGVYSCDLPPGNYSFVVDPSDTAPDLTTWYYPGQAYTTFFGPFLEIVEGVDVEQDVTLELGATISGTTFDPSGNPASGVSVFVFLATPDGRQVVGTGNSDLNGDYSISGLPVTVFDGDPSAPLWVQGLVFDGRSAVWDPVPARAPATGTFNATSGSSHDGSVMFGLLPPPVSGTVSFPTDGQFWAAGACALPGIPTVAADSCTDGRGMKLVFAGSGPQPLSLHVGSWAVVSGAPSADIIGPSTVMALAPGDTFACTVDTSAITSCTVNGQPAVSDDVEVTVDAGGTVATTGGSGPADPLGTSVMSPSAGVVSIEERPTTGAVSGYDLLGWEALITAPPGSVGDPLVIELSVHASLLGGTPVGDVVVLRNQVPVVPCADASGDAVPDPCLASATVVGDTAVFRVLTSAASTWNLGVSASPSYVFSGFAEPVVGTGVTKVKGGSTLPLKWRLTDESGAVTDPASFVSLEYGAGCPGSGAATTAEAKLQSDGSWHLNWEAPKATGSCTLQLVLGDGSIYPISIRLT